VAIDIWGVNYDSVNGPAGSATTVKVGDKTVFAYEGKAPLKKLPKQL
jgi:hypothetical protein